MDTPVVFFAFANNNAEAYLSFLREESSNIKKALLPLEQKNFIKLEREESINLNELHDILLTYNDRICIFHYAGHAHNKEVVLESGRANIAHLLGQQKNLQLVFLNGCSTAEQVDIFFKNGVKAVIATSAPIEDTKAKDFASRFYEALAQKQTLKRAFEFARASIKAQYGDDISIEIIARGIGTTTMVRELDRNHWQLYVQEDSEKEILSWHLPYFRQEGLPKDLLRRVQSEQTENRYLRHVLDAMCRYNEDIYHQKWEVHDGEEQHIDSSEIMSLIIENFPWIISSQIRLLCIEPFLTTSKERLDQLLSTYTISTQLIYFIVLADIWDKIQQDHFELAPNWFKPHQLRKDNLLKFDFLQQAYNLHLLIQSNDGVPFLPELEDFFHLYTQPSSHLAKAKKYLQTLKETVDQPLTDVAEKCQVAEKALTAFLRDAAFLSAYKFLAVRFINIENQRCFELEYELELGKLNGQNIEGLKMYENIENRRKKDFCACRSVVIVSNEKEVTKHLNLSPFIIDKNTFLQGRLIDPFMFAYENENEQVFYYHTLKHNIFTALKNKKGTDLIHTGMTDKDFDKGANITAQAKDKNTPVDDFDFGFDDFEEEQEEGKAIFVALEKQFEQLKSDFS